MPIHVTRHTHANVVSKLPCGIHWRVPLNRHPYFTSLKIRQQGKAGSQGNINSAVDRRQVYSWSPRTAAHWLHVLLHLLHLLLLLHVLLHLHALLHLLDLLLHLRLATYQGRPWRWHLRRPAKLIINAMGVKLVYSEFHTPKAVTYHEPTVM